MGVVINSLSVLVGGLLGGLFRNHIPQSIKEKLPVIFGLCAFIMGVVKAITMNRLTVVVLSIIIGYLTGELMHLDQLINNICSVLSKRFSSRNNQNESLITIAFVIFCFSGTGLFGAFTEGILNDSSILLSKSVLDFFTAIIFASIAGYIIGFISIFQFAILLSIHLASGFMMPILQGTVMADFVSVGGIITVAVGLKMMKVVDIELSNLLPALLVVIAFSNLMG